MYYNPTTCHVCHRSYNVGNGASSCPHCKMDENKLLKEKFMTERSTLSVEERLTKLESDLYDLQRRKPVYVPPPRYG